MSDSKILKRFFALYAATYMTNAVYGTFMPVYLKNLGFNDIQMGSLLALAPFIAIAAQPVWGTAGDRAKTKNFILNILLSGGAATILLYPLSSLFGKLEYKFAYMFAIMSVFTFFQTSVNPLSDAITLEYIDSKGWKFGPIRMAGTLGFAVMSVVAGIAAKLNFEAIFVLYFLISISAVLIVSGLPGVKGHQSQGKKVPMWLLLKNRELVLLMGISLVVQTTLGFYYSFFPKYYTNDLGADNLLLGLGMFISAVSEVPFLLFADRVVKKLGVHVTLTASAGVVATRWLLLFLVTNKYAVLGINALHGLSFIVFAYSLATYINANVPKELRASGQALNGLVGMGIARILGSVVGGFLSQAFGTRQVFLFTSLLDYCAVAVFGALFIMACKRKVKA